MNVLSAVISGILGSFAISMVMAVAPLMGMPKMDIVDMLSTMFGKPNRVLGWMMHLMMGVIPIMHAGIKNGDVEAPGLWMTNQGSMLSFVGGLMGQMVFGLVVALVYQII